MQIEKIIDILHEYFNVGNNIEAMIDYMNCAEEILDVIDSYPIIMECEGYKMFKGTMLITPKSDKFEPFELEGIWLYKPEYDCWYCKGRSYMNQICTIKEAAVL